MSVLMTYPDAGGAVSAFLAVSQVMGDDLQPNYL